MSRTTTTTTTTDTPVSRRTMNRRRAAARAANVARAAVDPGRSAAMTAAHTAATTLGVPVPAPTAIGATNRKRATAITPADAAIASAVRFARYGLHAHMPTFRGTDRRPAAASSSDHVAVREHVRRTLGDTPTADALITATGYASYDALTAVARGDDNTSTDPIGPFTDAVRASTGGPRVQWRTGRWAAGIVAAMIAAIDAPDGIIPDPRDTPDA